MSTLGDRIKRWVIPDFPAEAETDYLVKPGLYAYQTERDGQYVRYHLRVELSGQSLLLAAASEAVRLSRAGTVAAKTLLDGMTMAQASDLLPYENSFQVVESIKKTLSELGLPGVRFPVFNLADPAAAGQPVGLIAPFQADVVLGEPDVVRLVLDRLWAAGIPHVRLVKVEDRPDEEIVRAVERAEDIGMIAGLRAKASDLIARNLISATAKVGLDYVVLPWGVTPTLHETIFGEDDHRHLADAANQIAGWEMTAVIDVPLTRETLDVLEDGLNQLTTLSVAHAEVFALAANDAGAPAEAFQACELRQVAAWIEDIADQRRMQIIWLPPAAVVSDPIAVARRGPRASGDVSIRVEADGSVVPPRGPNQSVGNITTDAWEQIWEHDRFQRYRQLVERDTRCDECPGLSICAADCPADPEGWVSDE